MPTPQLLDGLDRASAGVGDLLDRVAPDQWTAPTPCTEWTVRDVVGHLVGLNLVFVAMLTDGPPPERGPDRLGADPAGAFRGSAAALLAAAERPGALERTQDTPVGTATGRERLRWRVADLLVHAWDIAQATRLPLELPADLVEEALDFTRDQLPRQARAGRFAEPRPVGADAPALDRLAAFAGRPVPWTP